MLSLSPLIPKTCKHQLHLLNHVQAGFLHVVVLKNTPDWMGTLGRDFFYDFANIYDIHKVLQN